MNFVDYAVFGGAWGTEANDANYNGLCDLQDNNNIDFNDLSLFCDDWLWKKAWGEGWMMLMGSSGEAFGPESMILESALALESAKTAPMGRNDDLMLSSAIESLAARPERLISKSEKFYAVNAFNTISALQARARAEEGVKEVDVEGILKWLAEIWLDPDVQKSIDEEKFLKFYESLKELE